MQILEWLSHNPSDMESYIRPGCVILSIFVSMPSASWERVCVHINPIWPFPFAIINCNNELRNYYGISLSDMRKTCKIEGLGDLQAAEGLGNLRALS